MGTLLVVTGPPGAGKSTVARLVAARASTSVLVEGDALFGFLASGAVAPWLPESHAQNGVVTRAAGAAAGRFATGGYRTVYDGVLGPWFLPVFAAATGLDRLDYVVLLPGAATCVARVTGRRGHGFADEGATRRLHAQFATARVDSRHVLAGPQGAPETVADRVEAAARAGTLAYLCR